VTSLAVAFDSPAATPTGLVRIVEAEQRLFLDLRRMRAIFRRESLPATECEGCGRSLALVARGQQRCHYCGWQLTWEKSGPWLLNLARFSEDALSEIRDAAWPGSVKKEQRHLIGRESGLALTVKIGSHLLDRWEDALLFVARPEYFLAASFLYVRFDHPALGELADSFYREEFERFCKKAEALPPHKRGKLREEAPLTGIKAINPVTLEFLPVVASAEVPLGLDAVLGVPAYCERDRAVARRHRFPAPRPFGTATPPSGLGLDARCSVPGPFEGESVRSVRERITEALTKRGVAKREVRTALREVVCSAVSDRGVPVPVISCSECGDVPARPPVLEGEAKGNSGGVLLPSSGGLRSCPRCGKALAGETHRIRWGAPVTTTLLEVLTRERSGDGPLSVWAFLPVSQRAYPFLRARILAKFLRKRYGFLKQTPLSRLVLGAPVREGGEQILRYAQSWGSDGVRIALLGAGAPGQPVSISEPALRGAARFLAKVRILAQKVGRQAAPGAGQQQDSQEKQSEKQPGALPLECERMIYTVTRALDRGRPHLAVASLIRFLRFLNSPSGAAYTGDLRTLSTLAVCLAPFAPYHAELLYQAVQQRGEEAPQSPEQTPSVFSAPWPAVPEKLPQPPEVEVAVFFEGRPCDRFTCPAGSRKQDLGRFALSRPKVQERLQGRRVKWIFAVPDYLVNLVPKSESEEEKSKPQAPPPSSQTPGKSS